MTTVVHKIPDFTGVPLYTLKRGDCFKLEGNDNHLYMKIGIPDGLIQWVSQDAQYAIDLDSSNKKMHWFKSWTIVKEIDVEIKEL